MNRALLLEVVLDVAALLLAIGIGWGCTLYVSWKERRHR